MRTTRYRVGGGGGSGTPTECTPTAVFAETFGMDDFLQIIYGVNWPDSFAVTEGALGVKVKLFDTLGMDDRLTLVRQVTSFVDTFGITEGALGVAVKLFETLGADDRLTFVDLLTTYADSFGIADALTLATIATVYADTLGITDGLSFVDLFTNQLDTVGVAETSLDPKVTFFDTAAATDNLFADLDAVWLESLGHDDALTSVLIANWTCGRSGTPDTDPTGDAWIDQASAGTNHGNETPLIAKGKSTLANDERRACLFFDFTRYSGLTAKPGGTHTVTLRCTNTSVLLAVDLTVALARRAATRPFTESTITWTIGDGTATAIKNVVQNIAANSTVDVVCTLTDAELDLVLTDGWLRLRCTTPTAAAPISVNIASRESATVADRPTYDIELRR